MSVGLCVRMHVRIYVCMHVCTVIYTQLYTSCAQYNFKHKHAHIQVNHFLLWGRREII